MQLHRQFDGRHGRGSTAWASAIAILFAVMAATSFAVDLTISLSVSLPPRAGAVSR